MSVLVFIKDLLIATFGQMAALFGGIVIIGLLLHVVSLLTFRSLERAFGNKGIFFVAWLGVPVHELSHALFCLVFLHRIEEIALFRPDPDTGTLGYVHHTWDRHNPWAVLGNVFIGVGPVVIGAAALFGLFYGLVTGAPGIWNNVNAVIDAAGDTSLWQDYWNVFTGSALAIPRMLFTADNLVSWQFWLFLYLAVCISSNLRLSPADMRGALSGLGCMVLPFLAFNLIAMLTGLGNETWQPGAASFIGMACGTLILALVLALIGLVITYPVSALYYRWRSHRLLNPFS